MTEISTDYQEPYDHRLLETQPSLAAIPLSCFIVLACCAFVPAVFKKRTYTFMSSALPTASPLSLLQIEEPSPLEGPKNGYRCSEEERKIIVQLFSELADATWDLPLKTFHFNTLGNKIRHVHPLALLLSVPRDKIQSILRSRITLKKSTFVKQIGEGLLRIKPNVTTLQDFAAQMGKDLSTLTQLIQERAWERFVHYLFDMPL